MIFAAALSNKAHPEYGVVTLPYRLKERKESMRQKQQIVNTLLEQGNA